MTDNNNVKIISLNNIEIPVKIDIALTGDINVNVRTIPVNGKIYAGDWENINLNVTIDISAPKVVSLRVKVQVLRRNYIGKTKVSVLPTKVYCMAKVWNWNKTGDIDILEILPPDSFNTMRKDGLFQVTSIPFWEGDMREKDIVWLIVVIPHVDIML